MTLTNVETLYLTVTIYYTKLTQNHIIERIMEYLNTF